MNKPVVYYISRRTNEWSNVKRHFDINGLPLCGQNPRGKGGYWQRDMNEVTCTKCLKILKEAREQEREMTEGKAIPESAIADLSTALQEIELKIVPPVFTIGEPVIIHENCLTVEVQANTVYTIDRVEWQFNEWVYWLEGVVKTFWFDYELKSVIDHYRDENNWLEREVSVQ